MLESNVMRLAAILLMGLTASLVGTTSALAAAPQRHDQAPGFYRLEGVLPVRMLDADVGA